MTPLSEHSSLTNDIERRISQYEGKENTLKEDFHALLTIFLENKCFTIILLLTIPLSFVSKALGWSDILTFLFSLIAILPLAWLLGEATENLSVHTGQTIGGLLNATFGNAVELIVSIFALKSGLLRIVQASLLGSVLGNLLLVLGAAILAGGCRYKEQSFNQTAAGTNASLLTLATIGMILPAVFNSVENDAEKLLTMSHFTAIFLFLCYLMYLLFQLYTHKHLFESTDEDEDAESKLSIPMASALLVVSTVFVSFVSEVLVDSIHGVTKSSGMNETFIGIILLPVVGNAAEHVTAIKVALKDKMDLALGVAVGSSTQIALFVMPVLVLIGWMIDQPLTLFFHTYETFTMFLAVLIVNLVVNDGSSNWLEGAMLLATYGIIAVSFWLF